MLFGFRKHKSIENHQYFKQLSIFFDKMVINIRAKAANFTDDFVHQYQSARALLLEYDCRKRPPVGGLLNGLSAGDVPAYCAGADADTDFRVGKTSD